LKDLSPARTAFSRSEARARGALWVRGGVAFTDLLLELELIADRDAVVADRRDFRFSRRTSFLSRGFVREQSRLDCLELALGERALRPQPRDFLELLDEFRR
jgi:hypothetical protein